MLRLLVFEVASVLEYILKFNGLLFSLILLDFEVLGVVEEACVNWIVLDQWYVCVVKLIGELF